MFTGIFEPAFLQAASNTQGDAPENNVIIFHVESVPLVNLEPEVSCVGEISIEYKKNGETQTLTYSDLEEVQVLDDKPDDDSDVIIRGRVTRMYMSGPPFACINSLDVSQCKTLKDLTASFGNLQTLNLNTQLISLNVNYMVDIETIYYAANNSAVSTAVAGAITNADANNGIVYTDSAAAYYSIIADAATAKGWTIQQLL